MKYFIPFLLVLNLTTGIDFILYSTPQLRLTTFQVSSSHMGQMVIILDSAVLELFFLSFFFFKNSYLGDSYRRQGENNRGIDTIYLLLKEHLTSIIANCSQRSVMEREVRVLQRIKLNNILG